MDLRETLIKTKSRRSSLVERSLDVLGGNRFFLRHGKPPRISSGEDIIVSPAHAKVAWVGAVRSDQLFPAKPVLNRKYHWTLSQILWDETTTGLFDGGFVFNLYLAPINLHYVVAPATCRVEMVRRCPGKCWPIVFWKLGEVENERVVALLRLEDGKRMAMVLVGSFLVSGVLFLPQPGDLIHKGDIIGGFKIGSTVFLATERDLAVPLTETGQLLLPGEPIARFVHSTGK